jgi:hypothetical protein
MYARVTLSQFATALLQSDRGKCWKSICCDLATLQHPARLPVDYVDHLV